MTSTPVNAGSLDSIDQPPLDSFDCVLPFFEDTWQLAPMEVRRRGVDLLLATIRPWNFFQAIRDAFAGKPNAANMRNTSRRTKDCAG
jgi:hypothetical protein